ncbi:Ni/Fe hydrogenase subunit alpha [Rhodococcus sp. IEGM 1379]|uniref:Ni/Fe hydrogenase subunit alpha n=1 Tax=Rhodococcus sp. IEGM 1379 TaxID=3047086 RepID=UPI0024B7D420|nr:Ni/Fe hydrogenase subunit alpha [Rhodococcus sp. IEGM 1379]MDI9914444.1 Ni/Fe hydrogenase subunit alpha [Rhodococcus sp. IEGM 1379]
MDSETTRLTLGSLARVEGEGRLAFTVRHGRVESAELNIYEPPRFFESFLRGRDFREPPDITSRICGICPVAYQVSACNAIEQACGTHLTQPILDLRRLLYCGEWIASHTLHIYLLHAPDFLGAADAIELARIARPDVERGLALKKAGNAILELIGGRSIHPVNVRLGGFYRAPTPSELEPLAEQLRTALDDALATVRWVSHFEFPDTEIDSELLALAQPGRYAIEDGMLTTTSGLSFTPEEFSDHVEERQVPYSTALHAHLDGQAYLAGPLARYSLHSAELSDIARQAATEAGLGTVCRNPFQSIVVRAVETVFAVDEALRLIREYQRPDRPFVDTSPRAATGYGVSEAPRGMLYHRYELDSEGHILRATIIPPTSQNQAAIEIDLRNTLAANLRLTDTELAALCERTIRNYDPCISCATHFLDLTVDRG